MSVEENIVLMRRWFKEVWNEGRVQTIYDLMSENGVGVGQDQPGVEIHGPADFAALSNRLHGAFPDMKITVEDTFGADDKVVVRWSAKMTHTGDHLGIPATHKPVHITIARIEKGKIVQGWDNWDQLALMQQLATDASTSATA
ncbi:MAG TPA: ester cyclase [Candidatus Sulfotelmatobacter sp.]|nr:ester cyclase [Candidatus Sulfotelmatobacter sp.]